MCACVSALCILLYAGMSQNYLEMAVFYSWMSDFNHAMLGKIKVQEKWDANLFMGVGERICCFFQMREISVFSVAPQVK